MPEVIKLTTPDHIELEYQLGGISSRGIAVFLDHVVQGFLMMGFSFALSPIMRGYAGIAVWVVVMFLVFWSYFIVLEWLWNGRTIGKYAAGLRVMRDDGRPLDFSGAALRNLIRIIDFLPWLYGIGTLAMFFNREQKRLGDLAAGTIVVVETRIHRRDVPEYAGPVPEQLYAPQQTVITGITKEDRDAARRFLERRFELPVDARMRLGREIAATLAEKAGYTQAQVLNDPEAFLELVARSE